MPQLYVEMALIASVIVEEELVLIMEELKDGIDENRYNL